MCFAGCSSNSSSEEDEEEISIENKEATEIKDSEEEISIENKEETEIKDSEEELSIENKEEAEIKDNEEEIEIESQASITENTNTQVETMDNNVEENTMMEPFLFGEKDIYINSKPVLDRTYSQLTNDFGIPKDINKFKVNPPACGDDYFMYFNVLVYDGLECELSLGEEDREVEDSDSVFRFDITNKNFPLDCGLQIGMTTEEILSKYGPRSIYNISSSNPDSELIKPILESYKPEDCYSEYSQAMIIYSDQDKFEEPLAKALVLLIENSKLDRIVFCYPTAN
jgi:hypothetical protein